VKTFAVCEFTLGGDRGFQIDQTNLGSKVVKDRSRVTPGPPPVDRTGNRPIHPFGQLDVSTGIIDTPLTQGRVPGVRKDLIDAATEHDVTA
jgi:hypothetical protein